MKQLISLSVMSLLKYFQMANPTLPKPDGPLSTAVPSSSIAAANREVKQLLDKANKHGRTDYLRTTLTSKRGTYERFTAEEKAKIGRRAAEHSVMALVCYFYIIV